MHVRQRWLIPLILAVIACFVLPSLVHARSASGLKALIPEEDYTGQPDPADVFDQAVKAYTSRHYDEAEKLFQKVIELDPTNADAQYNLGAIKEWNKDYTQALLHYEAALKLKPDDKEIKDAVTGVAYKIRNLPEVEAREDEAKRERELQMHGALAKQAFARQNYAVAAQHLAFLARAMPEDSKVQFALGQSLRAIKSFEMASYRLKLAIYLDPENELYRHTLVELDKEVQSAQGQAIEQTIRTALRTIAPFSFTELGETGVAFNEF